MIWPILEARQRLGQKYKKKSFVYGSNENFKICFRDLLTFRLKMWTESWSCVCKLFSTFYALFLGFSNLVVLRLTDLVDPVDFRFREAEVKVMFKAIIIRGFEHPITTNPQMVQWTMGALVGTIGTIRPIGLIITATTPRGPLCLTIGTDLIMKGQGNKTSLR